MDRVEEYLEQAKECLDAAAKAKRPETRAGFIQMAESWEVLARQRIADMHLEGMLAEIAKLGGDKGGLRYR